MQTGLMPNLKPTRGAEINRMHPLSRGLAGLWILNEGTGSKIFDASGNRHTGTLTGMDPATDWVAGKNGFALDFDGSNDHVAIPSSTPIAAAVHGGVLAISMLVKINDLAVADQAFIGFYADSNNRFYLKRSTTAGDVRVYQKIDGVADGVTTTDNLFTDLDWHHLLWVINGTASTIYVDGVFKETLILANSVAGMVGDPSTYLATDHTAVRLKGQIGTLGIFNRQLTVPENTMLYRDPFCMFNRIAC